MERVGRGQVWSSCHARCNNLSTCAVVRVTLERFFCRWPTTSRLPRNEFVSGVLSQSVFRRRRNDAFAVFDTCQGVPDSRPARDAPIEACPNVGSGALLRGASVWQADGQRSRRDWLDDRFQRSPTVRRDRLALRLRCRSGVRPGYGEPALLAVSINTLETRRDDTIF
jgi:hypothetical protein